MGQSIEEYKLTEKIKLSYLRHRGNVLAISEELQLPVDYVKKMVLKFKGKESRDVATLISHNLMSHVMLGYESRVHNLMEMLKMLDGRDKNKISVCCEAPVRRYEETIAFGYEDYECLACHLKCEVKILDKEAIIELRLGVLEQLREEDRALVEFAERMGYTNKEPTQPAPYINQNFVVVRDRNKAGDDAEVVKELKRLSPMERDILVEKLTKAMTEKTTVDVKPELPSGQ